MQFYRRVLRSVATLSVPLLGGVFTAVGAQQPGGNIYDVLVNPLNPDIIAYEARDGGRQELRFKRVISGRSFAVERAAVTTSPGTFVLPGASAGGEELSSYSGDIDWRPRVTDGRYWFAYVARNSGRLEVRLNFIDRDGEVGRDPVVVQSALGGRTPRWSPDGQHLAFVSDSNFLHVIWGADRMLRSGGDAAIASRLSGIGTTALAPAWSPPNPALATRNALAYQVERTIQGVQRYNIEVLMMDTERRAVVGAPVSLTSALANENAYRPSWSADGRYIAFYTDRVGSGADASGGRELNISVVEAQVNRNTGRVFRGELLAGRSPRLAQDVVPNASRGPSWARLTAARSNGEVGFTTGVLFVQQDATRSNPVVAASVDLWLAMRAPDDYQQVRSGQWGTVNHRFVSSTVSRGMLRYAYVSVSGGGEVLRYVDEPAAWADGPAPAREGSVVATRAGSSGLALNLIAPGAGQWTNGRKRGWLYTAMTLAGGALGVSGALGTKDPAADAEVAAGNGVRNLAAYETAYGDWETANGQATTGLIIAGAGWALSLLDSAMSGGGDASRFSMRAAPAPSVLGYGGLSTQFGVSIAFGGAAP